MTIINKRLINYILIDKRLNEHFGQISIDFWSLEITEIKFEIRNQLEIKLISKSRTRFQQVSDPSMFGSAPMQLFDVAAARAISHGVQNASITGE